MSDWEKLKGYKFDTGGYLHLVPLIQLRNEPAMQTEEPLYYVKGDTVFKRPVRTPKDGGGATITIGFPVCKMTDFVGSDGAQFVADALNAHESH